MTTILGISAFYHDSAAAILVDGKIVAAAQEERFSRKKHDEGFPTHAIDYCLREVGIKPSEIDLVAFYDKPFLKFQRLLETYLAYVPAGFESFLKALPVWLRQKLYLSREIRQGLKKQYTKKIIYTEHHESHAASAFFPSPFEDAAIVTLDGVGEWATASIGHGRGNRIELLQEMQFPHSLGLLYSAFTYFCGFSVNSGEYKLMGLAPYGEPKYVDLILSKLLDLKDDGSFRLDLSYFNYCQGLTMTSQKFDQLFGGPPRKPESLITDREMDLAASIQKVTEEIMLRTASHAHKLTGSKNLCLAGGVALNCVGNGRILREGPFDDVWIQPAAGDAGGALGAAIFTWYQLLDNPREPQATDEQFGSLLGPEFSDEQIKDFLETTRADYEYVPSDAELCRRVADEINDGKVIGWFQGRMEFGPRALGARSILGDPRRPDAQTTINVKVKYREGFRPFAPIVLREHVADYFDFEPRHESPYMLLVCPVLESRRLPVPDSLKNVKGIDKLKIQRSQVPAITHVDYSARIQTVDPARHGILRKLMESFYEKTGCPVLVNTSFNLGWDPIVCTPKDAFDTFMGSDIDLLCMGHYILTKPAQRATIAGTSDDDREEIVSGLLCNPSNGADLTIDGGKAICEATGHTFERSDGIWRMFWPHEKIDNPADVTERVKAFYEETPFPNYDDHDSVRSLIEKARKGAYAHALDSSIPYNTTVLEVGCGTGQLTNFLGISCRRVIGADLCGNSLKLGEKFRREHNLNRVQFVQMNLFRPCFKPEQFDVILCNGVLHHTADPYGGFCGLLPLLKPGGHIVIGLYNTYGRLATDFRRRLFRLTGNRAKWIDPILREGKRSEAKHRAWFADQYCHPHESKHTMGEVLRWFDENGLEFVRGVPSVTPSGDSLGPGMLFESEPRGSAWDHFLVQAREIVTGNKEGGFFLMIGQKTASRPVQRRVASSTH